MASGRNEGRNHWFAGDGSIDFLRHGSQSKSVANDCVSRIEHAFHAFQVNSNDLLAKHGLGDAEQSKTKVSKPFNGMCSLARLFTFAVEYRQETHSMIVQELCLGMDAYETCQLSLLTVGLPLG